MIRRTSDILRSEVRLAKMESGTKLKEDVTGQPAAGASFRF
jgi:hypothetical protein